MGPSQWVVSNKEWLSEHFRIFRANFGGAYYLKEIAYKNEWFESIKIVFLTT